MTRRNTYVCERSSDRYSAIQNGKDNRYSFLCVILGKQTRGIEVGYAIINAIMKHGVKSKVLLCVFVFSSNAASIFVMKYKVVDLPLPLLLDDLSIPFRIVQIFKNLDLLVLFDVSVWPK